MSEAPAQLPFRWDLVTPDQLGSLLAGTTQPDLWFLESLVECAGKVVARSGGGELVFVGRSLDSMFDLLSGALADAGGTVRLSRLPFSFQRVVRSPGRMAWRRRPLTTAERAQARRVLAGLGLAPVSLARRAVPVVFTDVVAGGSTFGDLFAVLRAWIDDEHAQWDVIRRKLRFTGVTSRVKTSPNAFRWQQHAPWTRQLPASSIVNVSLDRATWSYLADHQAKLTRSFPPAQWLAEAAAPGRDDNTRQALAEAVTLVSYGRSPQGRKALARTMDKEPALSRPWLRSLITHLNSGT
jgi:hypothetical protein